MRLKEYLRETFFKLLSFDSVSFKERGLADVIASELTSTGFTVYFDPVPAPDGSSTINLRAVYRTGNRGILFSAHLDTVESTSGLEVELDGDIVRSSGNTILGADDKAGIAAILAGCKSAIEKAPLPVSVEIVLTSAEERGLWGARYIDRKELISNYGFVLDGEGRVGTLVISAPYHEKVEAWFKGKAAHAGVNAKEGKPAILAMSKAIASIRSGFIEEGLTANIGLVSGGSAMNIVPENAYYLGEVRSEDEERLIKVVEEYRKACEKAAAEIGVEYRFQTERLYNGYQFSDSDEVIQIAKRVLEKLNIKPVMIKTMGGSDANILNSKGLKVMNVGIGCGNPHTKEEWIDLNELERAARFVEEAIFVSAEFDL